MLRAALMAAAGGAVLFVALLLLDPWGTLPIRSPLPRVPADHSQRWAYPELARDGRFDSAIIGNSTSRLFQPKVLGPAVGGTPVNLAMVWALPYEQSRLLDVFLDAHPAPHYVQIGIERTWCERGENPARFGYEPIPEWLYRRDWAPRLINLFSLHAIETASRSLSAVLGFSERPWGADGFTLLSADHHAYDPALAQRLIATDLAAPWPAPAQADPAQWRYPALDWLAERLHRIPAATRVALVFVPIFDQYPRPGSTGAAMMAECRRRVLALAGQRPGTEVYDMAFANPLTSDATRWWDVLHARPETIAEADRALAAALAAPGGTGPLVHRLLPPAE